MSTTKLEFQQLAQELIRGEFFDFTVSVTINQLGTFDYATQAASITNTATLQMIPYDYKANQFDGERIKVGDYMLIGERQLVSFEPSVDNCDVIVSGNKVNTFRSEIDPAQASIILHVRPQ
jgi:hypothetical protein